MLKTKPMVRPEDRRRSERHAMRGLGKIQFAAGSLPRDCWISDVSDGGVRLHVEDVAIPDQFVLTMSGMSGQRRECQVVWRLGHEVGAEFIDSAQQGFAPTAARGR